MPPRITLRGRELGIELRNAREAAGLQVKAAGALVGKSESTMSRIEAGRVGIRAADLTVLMDAYKITQETTRNRMHVLASESRRRREWWSPFSDVLPSNFRTWLGLEREAEYLCIYECLNIPGLLQVESYARAQLLVGPQPADADRRARLRMNRQEILDGEALKSCWIVLDEAALWRTVGGVKVMAEQLRHLLAVGRENPKLTIQVVPYTKGSYWGCGTPFNVISFKDGDMPDIVSLDQAHGVAYIEREEDVRRYIAAFNQLRAAAKPPDESLELIERLAARIE